jgi:hypothetical protein
VSFAVHAKSAVGVEGDIPVAHGSGVAGEVLKATCGEFVVSGARLCSGLGRAQKILHLFEQVRFPPNRHRHHMRVPHHDHDGEGGANDFDGLALVEIEDQRSAKVDDRLGDLPIWNGEPSLTRLGWFAFVSLA